jgi:hypothetical protein
MKAGLKADKVDIRPFQNYLLRLEKCPLEKAVSNYRFPHLRITEQAFRKETERMIASYMTFLNEDEEYVAESAAGDVAGAKGRDRRGQRCIELQAGKEACREFY